MDIFSEKTLVITGHYGCGKTNLAINFAKALKNAGHSVTLADLDIVNPYFRTADFGEQAYRDGIELIASGLSGTSLDLPSLSPALDARIGGEGRLVIDVGGDDAGAHALGRYAPRLMESGFVMVYVVNSFRYLTREPCEALELLQEIEKASRIKAGFVINNSNLSYETSIIDVQKSVQYAADVSAAAGIPLAMTAVRRDLFETLEDKQGFYPVDIYMKPPWNH